MVQPDPLRRLRDFGLTEYSERTYVALLQTGVATAREISTQSKVPMGKIYRALEELQVLGLVTVKPENPKRYAPEPIEALVTRRQRELQAEIGKLERERAALAAAFRLTATARPETGLGDVLLKRGRMSLVQTIIDSIRASEESILHVASPGFIQWWRWYEEEYSRAQARGVKLRFLLAEEPPADDRTGLSQYGEVRVNPSSQIAARGNAATIVVDDRRVFLAAFVHDATAGARDIGVYTDQDGLVAGIATLAESIWAAASAPKAVRT